MDSFSVCALMRETPAVVARFLAHYRAAGAERIFLYFDGEAPAEGDALRDLIGAAPVSWRVCDAAFWRDLTGRAAPDLDTKLVGVFRQAIGRNSSDWILFCDADELAVGDRPLGAALAELSPDLPGIRLRNTEAVWGPGDDLRAPFGCGYERGGFPPGRWGRTVLPMLVYGRSWRTLRRGTTGHVSGKQLLRRGVEPDEMTSHSATVGGRRLSFLHDILPGHRDQHILHYDAIGFDRWVGKWQARITGTTVSEKMDPVRRKQMAQIAAALQQGRAETVFRRYNALGRWQLFVLARLGLARPIRQRAGGPAAPPG